jgi:hypothetical protein
MQCCRAWVEGADRYRNPDEDVPRDFEVNRTAYTGSAARIGERYGRSVYPNAPGGTNDPICALSATSERQILSRFRAAQRVAQGSLAV